MSTTIFPEAGDQITEAAWSAQNASLTVASAYRLSGYTLSAGTGLNANVAAGTCVVNGYVLVSDGTQAVSVTASQTNYIWLNEDGTLSSNTTGTNPGDELLLGLAVTDGSGVTSVSHDYNIKNGLNVYIRKPSDETVNNSTTLQNDDDFSFTVADGEQWEIDLFLVADSPDSSADLKITWTGSGGATVTQRNFLYGSRNTGAAGSLIVDFSTSNITWDHNVTANDIGAWMKSFLTVSGAGTVTLQWAQNTAFAGNSVLAANSTMVARRILG